jgi:hypothetical protein
VVSGATEIRFQGTLNRTRSEQYRGVKVLNSTFAPLFQLNGALLGILILER